jgi:serine/threonine protein kinase/Flp pilus assembly protein TadD
MALSAGTRLGPYEVLAPIGAGGMGEVYLAEDTRLDRKVALKLLPAEFTEDESRVRRFVQEAKAASALNHPNILTIHDIGQLDSRHYIAAEFIDGQTLRGRMAGDRMTLPEALDVAAQVANALAAAHEARIAHRDIKPENVMLRRDGYVKVLDFGLAKLTERPARETAAASATLSAGTDPGTVLGTVSYMSPEQARGVEVDTRTDIFSLGVMLYEMIAGRRPFDGQTTTDVFVSILEREPPPLQTEAPAELQRIIAKALRKNREERYQTAKDFLLDLKSLREALTYETKTPASAISGDRVSVIQRHKVAAFAALVLLLLSIAGLAVYWQVGRAGGSIDSIAILPFVDQNHDPQNEYLSDGLTESIINNLTQISALRVIARTSVFRYKGKESDALGAAQALGVRAVVTGRVQQRGDNLTVSAELVDVRENKQLWGQRYDRKLADVFSVQEEIAKEISEKLRVKLTGAERQQLAKRPTDNLKAFQYYTQARAHTQRRSREDLLEAIRYSEKAIAEDGNYALAYAGLSDALVNLVVRSYMAPVEGRRKATEAALKALALDPNLAEAHVSIGVTRVTWAPFNFSQGDRELRRALELSPNLSWAHQILGFSFIRQGRFDESLAAFLKARELDPLSSINARGVAAVYLLKRDYARALDVLRQANELGPAFSLPAEIGIYIQTRRFDEALAALEQAKRERTNDPILVHCTGMVYAAQGKRTEALQIVKELEAMSGDSLSQALWIAKIHALMNEKEAALSWLDRGLPAGALGVFYKDEPVWDSIRSDPRFADLLRKMGVTQ